MKIANARVERFLRQPEPEIIAVLVYGPDQGLARERAQALVRLVVDDPGDPFRVVELTGAAVRSDPPLLNSTTVPETTPSRKNVMSCPTRDGSPGSTTRFLNSSPITSAGSDLYVPSRAVNSAPSGTTPPTTTMKPENMAGLATVAVGVRVGVGISNPS
ncbi:MAG: hypothetical protein IIC56_05750 [Proteobacteria bacterium]|nr:hypothetical protein [Pseudomonadota bacterium]